MDDAEEADRDEATGTPAPAANAVDLVKLVEKVRKLMQEDLRLEQARGVAASPGQRW